MACGNDKNKSSEQFLSAATALAQTTQSVCSQETDIDKARQAWKTVMAAWMPLQGVEKGSEQALAQSWRIQFYPDKKNTTGRKNQCVAGQ